MKIRSLSALIGTIATVACMSAATAPAAKAFTLGPDWTYTMDSFRDGNDGNVGVGAKSNYEMYGMAVKAQNGIVSIAFNANLALTGQAESSAADGNIGWGDLFFNFTGKSFKDASAAGELLGIRFAGTNDSGAASVGVYDNVKAKSVVQANSGFTSFSNYESWVNNSATNTTPGAPSGQHGQVGFGGLTTQEAKTYLTAKNGVVDDSDYSIQNAIASGNKVGDISFLGGSELSSLTQAFASLGAIGKYTIGFSFDQKFLRPGNGILSLLEECTNDGMALKVTVPELPPSESVPEPMTMLGLALGGLGLAGGKLKQRGKANAIG